MPSAQVAGLRKAGLNPILALGGGNLPPPIAVSSAATPLSSDIAGAVSKFSESSAKKKQAEWYDEQINLTKAQIDSAKAAAKHQRALADRERNYTDATESSTPMMMLDWLSRIGLTHGVSSAAGAFLGARRGRGNMPAVDIGEATRR